MKYTYAYKTPDGVRHEDAMDAASREEVFETLRAKGIKAIKVVAADGSKANGAPPRGWFGGRGATALPIIAVAMIGVVVWLVGRRAPTPPPDAQERVPPASSPRHQIYGDPVIVGRFEKGDFEGVLEREGDRMLAVFAQPGRYMCAKGANPRDINGGRGATALPGDGNAGKPLPAATFADYAAHELAPENDIPITPTDPREICELKQIVNGMREEMQGYLANGNGTPKSFWRRLNERTEEEIRIYERIRRELEKETSLEAWEEKNSALRRLGLRTIPNPNEQSD